MQSTKTWSLEMTQTEVRRPAYDRLRALATWLRQVFCNHRWSLVGRTQGMGTPVPWAQCFNCHKVKERSFPCLPQ